VRAAQERQDAQREAIAAERARLEAEEAALVAARIAAEAEAQAAALERERADVAARLSAAQESRVALEQEKLAAVAERLRVHEERERHEAQADALVVSRREAQDAIAKARGSVREIAYRRLGAMAGRISAGVAAVAVLAAVIYAAWPTAKPANPAAQLANTAAQSANPAAQPAAVPVLKLETRLDLTRTGASARSSLPGPDPSR
jgi:hypothetical protein